MKTARQQLPGSLRIILPCKPPLPFHKGEGQGWGLKRRKLHCQKHCHKASPPLSQRGGAGVGFETDANCTVKKTATRPPLPFHKGEGQGWGLKPTQIAQSKTLPLGLPYPFTKGRGRGGVWKPYNIPQCDISQQTLTRKLKKKAASFCVTTQPWPRLSCGVSSRDAKLVV